MTYFEKLKNPLWQKVRLQVFKRDDWTCLRCGAKDQTLHVHHLEYHGEPWDTPTDKLETLCETCHEWREYYNKFFFSAFRGITSLNMAEIVSAMDEYAEANGNSVEGALRLWRDGLIAKARELRHKESNSGRK